MSKRMRTTRLKTKTMKITVVRKYGFILDKLHRAVIKTIPCVMTIAA